MSTARWKDSPTRTVDVGGVEFAAHDESAALRLREVSTAAGRADYGVLEAPLSRGHVA